MLLFGVGYGAASLGCTLPLFLALVGASLGGAKLTAFVAYGIGMAVVLIALSVLVALAREGATRLVRPALPYMGRIAGVLLLASGGYLFYYWARLRLLACENWAYEWGEPRLSPRVDLLVVPVDGARHVAIR